MDSQIQFKMIIWTLGLVIGLGAITVLTVLQPPENLATKQPAKRAPAAASVTLDSVEPGGAPAETTSTNGDALAETVQVPCQPKDVSSQIKSSLKQARLLGQLCAESARKTLESSEILNMTNGLTATVFFTSNVSYTSDYMDLADGPNVIRVTHIFKDGSVDRREVTLARALPAAKK